ncbi:hypothetical protein [Kitasatospora griseola]
MLDDLPVGARLTRIRRIFFVQGARIDATNGPIELTFEDGAVRLFGSGPDGETLIVDQLAWVDPFAEPATEDNESFLIESGKWEVFDLSEIWSHRRFIGHSLTSVEGAGENAVRLTFDDRVMDIGSGCDELKVEFPAS